MEEERRERERQRVSYWKVMSSKRVKFFRPCADFLSLWYFNGTLSLSSLSLSSASLLSSLSSSPSKSSSSSSASYFKFVTTYPASSGFFGRLQRDRNHYEQPFAFPSSMRVHMMPTLKSQMASLPLVLHETLGT